jgi:hypothetical protein
MESIGNQSPLNLRFGVTRSNPKDAPVQVVRAVETPAMALAISLEAAKLKQAYLAECLRVSESYVSRWLSEERPIPRKFVARICSITGSNLLDQHLRLEEALTGRDPIAYLAAQLQVAA